MPRRFVLLDSIRGLGALCVVAYHVDPRMIEWTWGIMDLFFVLSGFLITRTMINLSTGDLRTASFFVGRALRILPAFLFTLFGAALVNVFLSRFSLQSAWQAFLPYLFFYQNLDYLFLDKPILPRIDHLDHLWSLMVEEHFYVLWGVFGWLVISKARVPRNLTVISTFGVCVLGAEVLARAVKPDISFAILPMRVDGFVLGCLLSLWVFARPISIPPPTYLTWLIWAAISLSCLRLVATVYVSSQRQAVDERMWLDITCFSILSCWLVYKAARRSDESGLMDAPLVRITAWFGNLSYELYLVHLPIIWGVSFVLSRSGGVDSLSLFFLVSFLSVSIAHFMNQYLTVRCLNQRNAIVGFIRYQRDKHNRMASRSSPKHR